MVRYGTKICKNNKSKIVCIFLLLLISSLTVLCTLNLPSTKTAFAKEGTSSYIVLEVGSKRIFKSDNAHSRLPMASTTKAMTALVVIENASLDSIVTIPKEAVGIEGSSIYLKEGEKLSVKELLYGLMLRSGNDAAIALAIHTAGNVKKFVELMNLKAQELGLKDTSFKNPHGLPAKNHYTSAYDLAIIASTGMLNATFRDIVSTKLYTVQGENEEKTRYFANKNRILYNYNGGNGVKTGYTTEAGRCLIAASVKDGMQVVAVALNHYNYFELCSNLMDYAHENFRMEKVIDSNRIYKTAKVRKGGKIKETNIFPIEDVYYPIKKDGSETVREEISAVDVIEAPHIKTNSCGEVKIYIDNHLKFSEKLYTIDIEKKFSIF